MAKKKILIVDDEKDILAVLGKRLSGEGYELLTSESGNDAISLAKAEHPNLIILDIGLADMHGGEVAMVLKENSVTKDIPVVFISALYSKSQEAEKSKIFGGKLLFAKPYEIDEVISSISALI